MTAAGSRETPTDQKTSWLPLVASAFLFAYMARLGADNLAGMLNFRAVQKMIFRTRLSLLRHLQRLSAEYHDNRPIGETLHRLQNDVDQVATLSGEVIPSALRTVTVFTLVMTTMLILNYQLTIIVLPLVPVFILVRRRFHDRSWPRRPRRRCGPTMASTPARPCD